VLQHVRAEDTVERRRRERQPPGVRDTGRWGARDWPRQPRFVEVDAGDEGAGPGEGASEVARPAPQVEHASAVEREREVLDGAGGKFLVERRRLPAFGEEHPEHLAAPRARVPATTWRIDAPGVHHATTGRVGPWRTGYRRRAARHRGGRT